MARGDQVGAQPSSRVVDGFVQRVAVGAQSLGQNVDRDVVNEQCDGDLALVCGLCGIPHNLQYAELRVMPIAA